MTVLRIAVDDGGLRLNQESDDIAMQQSPQGIDVDEQTVCS